MSPDSLGVELLALAATVAAAAGLGVVWGLVRGWWRVPVRAVAAGVCLATAAATGLLWVNRQVDEYPTWSSLFGETTDVAAPPPLTGPAGAGADRVVTLTVAGKASGLTMPMYAYLPPGYDTAPRTRFPVIEALHGYPGSPVQWFTRLDVATVLDREIGAGRMAPTVVLFPYLTPVPTLDTECTNLVGGAQTETYLTVDVPAAARARFHVRTDARGWGLIGYSAGGYCAGDLALRHPGEYTAAASMSGYSDPGIHVGNGTEKTLYNDVWRLGHLPVPAVALYLSCARADVASLREISSLARAAHAPLSITTAYVSGGGHNAQTWRALEAPAYDWLSTTLGRPVPPAAATPTIGAVTPSAGPRRSSSR